MVDLNALSLPDLFRELTSDGSLERLIQLARDEDLAGVGDVTTGSLVEPERVGTAAIVAREAGVVAGVAAIERIIEGFGSSIAIEARVADGQAVSAGEVIALLSGNYGEILAIERTALNVLGRLCGVATATRRYVDLVEGTKAVICDTRKTTPGMRGLEKYAVRCGGGTLHRLGLHDAALYKDNHLTGVDDGDLDRVLSAAIRRVRADRDLRFVEVEVDRLGQLEAILGMEEGLVDVALLDNMPPETLREAVRLRDERAPGLKLEASGGITENTVRAVAETGVDRISIGALTHSVRCLDVGLDVTHT